MIFYLRLKIRIIIYGKNKAFLKNNNLKSDNIIHK